MIDLTLNSFLHPDLVGLNPPFGTIIERTAENKGGLSTAQTDNNMAMPFALMRPVTVATSDTTSKVEYDAKLLLTGSSEVTITLDIAAYDGCRLTITNRTTAVAIITAEKIEGVAGGRITLGTNCVLELNYTESDGWVYSNAIVGEIRILTETEAPAGWLICDDTEYNTLQYPRLAPIMLKLPFNAGVTDGRFRVPDLRGRFLQGADGNLGQTIEAGLPNIMAEFVNHWRDYNGHKSLTFRNGALYNKGTTTKSSYPNVDDENSGQYTNDELGGFDASRSSPVYGNSDTVQPPALTVNYIIKY